MGCCDEKLKYERLSVFSHARILASQEAFLTNKIMAIVKKTHQHYGEYYIGIPYDTAKAEGRYIFKKLSPN